jgi:hypothetical protein
MRGPMAEGSLPASPVPRREPLVPASSTRPATREDANPAQSLLPRMSVAAILDDAMAAFGLPSTRHQPAVWENLVELVNELDVLVDGRDTATQRELLLDVAVVAASPPGVDRDPSFDARTAAVVRSFNSACGRAGLEMTCRQAWSGHFELLALEHSIGHQISQVEEYVVHRCRTGRLLGLMLADLIPLRCRTGAFDRMAAWVGALGACAELIDSFWDLPSDYRRGHSAVEPTLGNRVALARAAQAEAPAVLEQIPQKLRAKLVTKVLLMGLNRSGRLNSLRTH